MIIGVLNEKGGSGKTTLTINLARAFQRLGRDVLLIDSDPQGSLSDWRAIAAEDYPPVVKADDTDTLKRLPQVAADVDLTLVDGAPQLEALAAAAVKVCDRILIPVTPSPFDVWSAESLVELVKHHQVPAAFVVSRLVPRTVLSREIEDALTGYGLPILHSNTHQRQVYPASASEGRAVVDRWGPGRGEMMRLAEEVLKWH